MRGDSVSARRQRISELRTEGYSLPQVASLLGVSRMTVCRDLDSAYAERERERARRWKELNRESNRARDRRFYWHKKTPYYRFLRGAS